MNKKKIYNILKRKRVQGAIVLVATLILQQFNVVGEDAEIAKAVVIVIQALGGLWGFIGVVDAHPGHKEPA